MMWITQAIHPNKLHEKLEDAAYFKILRGWSIPKAMADARFTPEACNNPLLRQRVRWYMTKIRKDADSSGLMFPIESIVSDDKTKEKSHRAIRFEDAAQVTIWDKCSIPEAMAAEGFPPEDCYHPILQQKIKKIMATIRKDGDIYPQEQRMPPTQRTQPTDPDIRFDDTESHSDSLVNASREQRLYNAAYTRIYDGISVSQALAKHGFSPEDCQDSILHFRMILMMAEIRKARAEWDKIRKDRTDDYDSVGADSDSLILAETRQDRTDDDDSVGADSCTSALTMDSELSEDGDTSGEAGVSSVGTAGADSWASPLSVGRTLHQLDAVALQHFDAVALQGTRRTLFEESVASIDDTAVFPTASSKKRKHISPSSSDHMVKKLQNVIDSRKTCYIIIEESRLSECLCEIIGFQKYRRVMEQRAMKKSKISKTTLRKRLKRHKEWKTSRNSDKSGDDESADSRASDLDEILEMNNIIAEFEDDLSKLKNRLKRSREHKECKASGTGDDSDTVETFDSMSSAFEEIQQCRMLISKFKWELVQAEMKMKDRERAREFPSHFLLSRE